MAERMTVAELAELLEVDRATADRIRRTYREDLDAPIEWLTPEEAAATLEISTRQLRNLEARGIPCRGAHGAKRYAYPLCFEWYQVWRRQAESRRGYAGQRRLGALEAIQTWSAQRVASRAGS